MKRMILHNASDVHALLVNADPAGLLSDGLLQHISSTIMAPGPVDICHRPACMACGRTMSHSHSTQCHVLTPDGLQVARHVAQRCWARHCVARGHVVWSNFVARAKGKHYWCDGSAKPDIAMLTPRFGVTWSWHAQFTRRILYHHASFLGESLVHNLASAGLKKGRLWIANAWLKLQLLPKWQRMRDDPFPVSLPFPAIFTKCRDSYDHMVRETFQASAQQPVAAVIDGNQKMTRPTCAEQMAEVHCIPGTDLCFLQDCPRTPKYKKAFCSLHCQPAARDNGVRLYRRMCLARRPEDLLRATPPSSVDLRWPLHAWIREQIHLQSKQGQFKDGQDLDIAEASGYVSCQTTKMRKRKNRRSGGWMVACAGDGMVLAAREFFGGESLTQRAAFTAALIDQYPSVEAVIHDDSCHLRKFMSKWLCDYPRLTHPRTLFITDKFHSRAHKDAWCQANCSPEVAENKQAVQDINTSACEILFSWFSKYRSCFRTMNRQTGHFFVQEILLLRNASHVGNNEQ